MFWFRIALLLLGAQTFVIFLDFAIETLFFDELFSWLINGALAWIVRRMVLKNKTVSEKKDG